MNPHTDLIHPGLESDPFTGAVGVPIYQTSTFHQEDPLNMGQWTYARSENPTRTALETALAKLEGVERAFTFSSGMAAVSSVIAALVEKGDRIAASKDLYGGSHRILTKFFSKFGVETVFVDPGDITAWEKLAQKPTKLFFLESPSNPLLKITDLKAVSDLARAQGILTVLDNTFTTPWFQKPLLQGIDVVIHSATKFLGGHSDLVAGAAAARDPEIAGKIAWVQNAFGAILGPQDCFLLWRGLRTLGVRMERQQASAHALAHWLQGQTWIKTVHYPGLESHPGRDVHLSQTQGPGAILSFETDTPQRALELMKNVKLPVVAVSLGGVESILSWPERMSHAAIPEKERRELGITPSLLRFSVGLEDWEDLAKDLEAASH